MEVPLASAPFFLSVLSHYSSHILSMCKDIFTHIKQLAS
nr:MAG TPA: hypothetical protein [Caudoviricetes sp.]